MAPDDANRGRGGIRTWVPWLPVLHYHPLTQCQIDSHFLSLVPLSQPQTSLPSPGLFCSALMQRKPPPGCLIWDPGGPRSVFLSSLLFLFSYVTITYSVCSSAFAQCSPLLTGHRWKTELCVQPGGQNGQTEQWCADEATQPWFLGTTWLGDNPRGISRHTQWNMGANK